MAKAKWVLAALVFFYLPLVKAQTLLPFKTSIQYVGDHPYNWNDGAMIPAKGWQQYFNIGVQWKKKNWTVQLAPEFVSAQNLYFEGFSAAQDQVHWRDYYRFYNFVELPERMGDKPYRQFFWGQSFLQYQHKNKLLKFSTENKWWGPTQRNALILSTNAAGFPHISLANQQPLQNKWGSFQYELIWGQLINSNYPPPQTYQKYFGEQLYAQKENRSRSFQATHIQFTPHLFPNLQIGLEQSFVQYEDQLNGLGNYIPLKNIIYRFPNQVSNTPITLTALYFNYHFPKSNARIYGEYGWNLSRTSFRNWFLQPDKGAATVFGFSKIFKTTGPHYWELNTELSNLQLRTIAEQFTIGAPPSWYLGEYVRQGYTNNGEIIGAGLGPGGSSQTLEINWRKGKNRLGIMGERRVHNNDFYVFSFTPSGDFRRFYVDFATTLKMDWHFGAWELSPRLTYIQTNNYQWKLFQPATSNYFIPGQDIQQFQGQFNLVYHY